MPGLHNPGQMGRKWLEGSWTVPIVLFRLGAFAPLLHLCHTAELCACLPSRNEGGDWLVQGSLKTRCERSCDIRGSFGLEHRAGVALPVKDKDIPQTCRAFRALQPGWECSHPLGTGPCWLQRKPTVAHCVLVTEVCKGFVIFSDGSGMGKEKKKGIFFFYALFLL